MQIRYLCGCNMKAFECFLVIDNLMCSSTTIMRCFDQLQSLTNYVCRSCCAWQGEKRILQKRRVEKKTRGEGCEKWCLEIIDFPQTPGHGLQSQDRRSKKWWRMQRRTWRGACVLVESVRVELIDMDACGVCVATSVSPKYFASRKLTCRSGICVAATWKRLSVSLS